MRITKFAHACVRIEHEGTVLVLDPGGFTDAEAVDGATAVLITHEHFDHYEAAKLRATDAPVWTIRAVADQIAQGRAGRRRADHRRRARRGVRRRAAGHHGGGEARGDPLLLPDVSTTPGS